MTSEILPFQWRRPSFFGFDRRDLLVQRDELGEELRRPADAEADRSRHEVAPTPATLGPSWRSTRGARPQRAGRPGRGGVDSHTGSVARQVLGDGSTTTA